jgi:threonine/homoserine/homoserine lactone efflux protein
LLEKSGVLALPTTRSVSVARAFRQAVLAEVLNPKTALFFLAFLPQFVHPASGSAVAQFAGLAFIFVAMSAVYTSLLALVAGSFGRWLTRHRGIGRWQGKVVGMIYLGLGIRMAAQQR